MVEGETEFHALPLVRKRFPHCPPLRPVNLGGVGSDRQPIGIAKLLAPKIVQHKAAGRQHVLICMDREQRPECPGELAQLVFTELSRELASRGCETAGVHLVIADRTFEAWLLADAHGFFERKRFRIRPKFKSFEGKLGGQSLKGVAELNQLLGRQYDKVKDGPALFAELDFARARDASTGGSRSLDKLLRSLGL